MPENLPAVPGDAALAEDVAVGVIVGEDDRAPGVPPQPPVRAVIVLRPVVKIYQTVVVVVSHPVPRATVLVPAAGVVVAWRRWQRRRSLASAMAEQANAAGDRTAALAMLQQAELERKGRADRREQHVGMLKDLLLVSPWILGIWAFLMVLTGLCLAFAHRRPADVLWPWKTLMSFVADVVAVWTVAVWVLAFGAVTALYAALCVLGRQGDMAPGWARTAGEDDIDVTIDEAAVTQALAALRIPQIRDYLKLGIPLPYIVPCREEGRGTYCEIRLPKGLPATEIAKPARRERLAAGLYRHTKEVWPSVGGDANHLKLWIADKCALDEGAGPYPLLGEGFTDVFRGLPLGKTLRGDPINIPVIGRNTLCGGAPEQGKSTAAKGVACGYTLDTTTEVRIYVPDANFDFERFAPRCSSYVMGAEDEFIEQICGELEELKDELQKRGQLLIDAQAEEVTRQLAHAGIGLHPVFVLLEEAHVAIQHRKFGKDISQLLVDIVKLDRKRGVHLMLSTQAPTKDSMPRDVTRNCTNGIAFAVGDHVANDALLGQGAYRAGHRATDLIPGEDRGTALCKGFSGERSEIVQVHRIQGRAENDQVTPIVNRALAELARTGKPVPGTERGPLAIVSRDLLTDLETVLAHRSGKVRVSELPDLLHNLAPSWGPYRGLSGVQLRKQLMAEGVPTTNPGNVPTLDLDDLHRVIREREVS